MPAGEHDVTELVAAVAWWRADLPGARTLLADAATAALIAGRDGYDLVQLALIDETASRFDVDELIDRAAGDAGITEAVHSDLEPVVVHRLCHLVLHDEVSPRELTRWAHSRYRHGAGDESIDLLAVLDDAYDDVAEVDGDLAPIVAEIRRIATRIAARND